MLGRGVLLLLLLLLLLLTTAIEEDRSNAGFLVFGNSFKLELKSKKDSTQKEEDGKVQECDQVR